MTFAGQDLSWDFIKVIDCKKRCEKGFSLFSAGGNIYSFEGWNSQKEIFRSWRGKEEHFMTSEKCFRFFSFSTRWRRVHYCRHVKTLACSNFHRQLSSDDKVDIIETQHRDTHKKCRHEWGSETMSFFFALSLRIIKFLHSVKKIELDEKVRLTSALLSKFSLVRNFFVQQFCSLIKRKVQVFHLFMLQLLRTWGQMTEKIHMWFLLRNSFWELSKKLSY